MSDRPDPVLSTYRVTLLSPLLTGPLIMDLIATTALAAARRATVTAVHMYGDLRLARAEFSADLVHRGTCRQAGHHRHDCPDPKARPTGTA